MKWTDFLASEFQMQAAGQPNSYNTDKYIFPRLFVLLVEGKNAVERVNKIMGTPGPNTQTVLGKYGRLWRDYIEIPAYSPSSVDEAVSQVELFWKKTKSINPQKEDEILKSSPLEYAVVLIKPNAFSPDVFTDEQIGHTLPGEYNRLVGNVIDTISTNSGAKIKAAKKGMLSSNTDIRLRSIELFEVLFEKGQGFDAAEKSIKTGLKSIDAEIQLFAKDLEGRLSKFR